MECGYQANRILSTCPRQHDDSGTGNNEPEEMKLKTREEKEEREERLGRGWGKIKCVHGRNTHTADRPRFTMNCS